MSTSLAGLDLGFDKRWEKHPKPQATTAKVFGEKTGWSPDDLKGKSVLDAGCGCGRFSALAARFGAVVTGVDASPNAIAAAKINAPECNFLEADLLDLDCIDDASFDLAFSIGVLHHTASTERAFLNVSKKVKPGGKLAVWVYSQPCDTSLIPVERMLHEITRACPPEALHAIFERWAPRVRNLYNSSNGPLQQILKVSTSWDDDECISDTFDWHVPRYRWWHSADEVISWFSAAGYTNVAELPFKTAVSGVRGA